MTDNFNCISFKKEKEEDDDDDEEKMRQFGNFTFTSHLMYIPNVHSLDVCN